MAQPLPSIPQPAAPIVAADFPMAYPQHKARTVARLLARAMGPDDYERRTAVRELDAVQVRGGLDSYSTADAVSWTGYDYEHQCWLTARRVASVPA